MLSTVVVSEGKEKVEFDDYVGKILSQVERILEDEGYKEIRTYDVVSEEPVGTIVTQIQPVPGTMVVPEDTVVIFEVSSGPKQISLGNLIGLTLEQAKEYAERNDLKLTVNEDYSDTIESGRISKQSPTANSIVREGDTVTVTVSKGREARPPRSHKVTFTVEFDPRMTDEGELQTDQLVQIYVDDMNEDITEVFHEDRISSDKQYTLTLVIAENEVAEYRVVRDGKEIIRERIPY
jgi:beta-lactam-binding protein with PASTA domain